MLVIGTPWSYPSQAKRLRNAILIVEDAVHIGSTIVLGVHIRLATRVVALSLWPY